MAKFKEEKLVLKGIDLKLELTHVPDKKGRFVTVSQPDWFIIQIVADVGTHRCIIREFRYEDQLEGETLKEANQRNAVNARAQWEQLKRALQR
jgi:hypothetical protein